MQYKNTENIVKQAAAFYAYQAQLELQAKRPRTSIKAKWKRVGDSWQPMSVTRGKVRKNFVNSGGLVNSIEPVSRGLEFGIKFDWYGEAIINGRQPWPLAKFKGNKGIPVNIMRLWVKNRNIKPKDSQGKFIQNTEKNRNAMAFMMNRKIKHFGIEPFNFQQIAFNSMMGKFNDQIKNAVKEDIKQSINGNNNKSATKR